MAPELIENWLRSNWPSISKPTAQSTSQTWSHQAAENGISDEDFREAMNRAAGKTKSWPSWAHIVENLPRYATNEHGETDSPPAAGWQITLGKLTRLNPRSYAENVLAGNPGIGGGFCWDGDWTRLSQKPFPDRFSRACEYAAHVWSAMRKAGFQPSELDTACPGFVVFCEKVLGLNAWSVPPFEHNRPVDQYELEDPFGDE